MARLDALPSIDIIHGFKGVLDFYLWKGLPCVRSWPRMSKASQTEATKAAAAIFGDVSTNFRLLGPHVLAAFTEAALDQPRTPRDLYISAVYGHLHESAAVYPPPPPEGPMYNAYICLRDKKPPGTNGGTFTQGDWRTRDLNDEHADTADICSLAANQITLGPGTYRCLISAPAFHVDQHQARLYNITDSALLVIGANAMSSNDDYNVTPAIVAGRFTLAAEKVLQVQHRCVLTMATNGFGPKITWADEIYTVAEFWREEEP